MSSSPSADEARQPPSPELVGALLEELAATFDLGFPVGDGTLGEAVGERLRRLGPVRQPSWGSPGKITDVASAGSPALRFFYRPHLFPGMDPRLRLAHELQFDLLPTELPERSPVEIASVLESYCHLSGDLLGWRPAGDGSLILWIVDVSGHGIRAGLSAAVIRVLLAAAHSVTEPERLATWFDHSFRACRNPEDHRPLYATGFFVRLDPDGRGSWCSAGHPPAFLRRSDGTLQQLEASGPPLALLDGARWSSQALRLAAGDLLLLYSDGVPDHPDSAGEPFGDDRLTTLLGPEVDSAESLARRIFRAVSEHGSVRHLEDDLSFLVARRP